MCMAARAWWGVAGSVAHFWVYRCGWAPSFAGVRVRGSGGVLAAKVGPWLRLLRPSPREVGVTALGKLPKQLLSASFFFFFLKNSPCSSLPLHTRAWPLTQPNSPTRPGAVLVRPIMAQLFPVCDHSLCGCKQPPGVCHFILIPPSNFKHPGFSGAAQNLFANGGSC